MRGFLFSISSLFLYYGASSSAVIAPNGTNPEQAGKDRDNISDTGPAFLGPASGIAPAIDNLVPNGERKDGHEGRDDHGLGGTSQQFNTGPGDKEWTPPTDWQPEDGKYECLSTEMELDSLDVNATKDALINLCDNGALAYVLASLFSAKRAALVVSDDSRSVIGGVCNYAYFKQDCSGDEIISAFTYLNTVCGPNAAGWVEVGHRKDVWRVKRHGGIHGSDSLCRL